MVANHLIRRRRGRRRRRGALEAFWALGALDVLAAPGVLAALVGALLALPAAALSAAVARADPYRVTVVQTTPTLSERLTTLPPLEFGHSVATRLPLIRVNAADGYQRVQGFGAAMTDTSAWLIEDELPPRAGAALMAALFGSGGIRLHFLRVPVAASDFTRSGVPYSYDDLPAGRSDPTLSRFSIAHDRAYILPALEQARELDPALELLASPWSPPAWMKANDSLSNLHHEGTLLEADYGAWARYLAAFLAAYAHAGVPISALTLQNEPTVATSYPGMELSASLENELLVDYLTPALTAAGQHPLLFAGDLGWGQENWPYIESSIAGSALARVSGIAWHCYFGSPTAMAFLHARYPGLQEIVDECSPGLITPTPTPEIVISSLREWASTVALWNLALDPHGGPVQPPNHGCPGCLGLARISEATHSATLGVNFFQLGQASRFIQPGARRIASNNFVSYVYRRPGVDIATAGLDDVAVRNPDGSIVLLVYDNSSAPIRFSIAWRGRQLTYKIPAGAMATLIWNLPGGSGSSGGGSRSGSGGPGGGAGSGSGGSGGAAP